MTIRGLILALLALALAACEPYRQAGYNGPPDDMAPEDFTCCHDPETAPKPVVMTAFTLAEVIVPLSHDRVRPGKITGKPDAHKAITDRARPGDIVMLSNKTSITGRFLPGHFSHAAVYLGTEAELRAVGMWNDPAMRPYQDEIRAGRVFVEALTPEVKFTTPAPLFEVDAAVILRPHLNLAQRRQALREVLARIGVPFDFWFDFSENETLACTELIELAMPSLPFTRRVNYGIPSVLPDDVVAQAIRGGEGFTVVAHIRGTKDGYEVLGIRSLMQDIGAWWGPQPEN